MFAAQQDACSDSWRFAHGSPAVLLFAVVLFAVVFSAPARAADRYWIDSTGGGFSDAANWSTMAGGAGGASVPGAADIANFTLNNTYAVDFAAAHTNTDLEVEYGTVTFELGGNTYTLTSATPIDVGNTSGQTGRLTVKGGTLAVDTTGDQVKLGAVSGSSGYLTVSTGGRIGDDTFRPDFYVGWSGPGTLTVDDDGRIDGRYLLVGYGGTGTAMITGPNAVVDLSQYVHVGDYGTGTCNVQSGGTLLTGNVSTLGAQIGDNGTVNVSGIGSSWTGGTSVRVGYQGDGSLSVSSGGRVSSGSAHLGTETTGVGTATVSGAGSVWELFSLYVGHSGTGNLTISSGGQVTSTSVTLGTLTDSEGRVTVTGAGSQWETGGNSITVGSSGDGDFTISSGGEVSASSLTLGGEASGAGDVTVSGNGSRLALSGSATISNLGYGTLNLADDAEIYVATDFTTGDPAGAPIGTFNLDGGSLYVGDDFANSGVFHFSDGLLRVVGDFQPSASAASFAIDGDFYDDLPTLDLIGSGTTANIAALTIGEQLRGEVLVRQGRLLNLAANNVNIGALASSEGKVLVESGGELRTTGTLAVGGSGSVAGGAGTLDIDGGTVDVTTLRLHRGGTVNLIVGTLKVDSIPTLDGNFIWTSGRLQFDANTTLSDASALKFLGVDKSVRAGQTLATSAASTLTLETSIVVDGGTVSVGALNSQNTLAIRSGLIQAGGTSTNTGRIELDDGTIVLNALNNQNTLEVQSGLVDAYSDVTNNGFVYLHSTLATLRGASVSNSGTIRGTGTVSGAFTNNTVGQVEVLAGERLIMTGASSSNLGHISVIGGELQVNSPLTNQAGSGLVSARDAILRFASVTNNSSFAFSNGTVDVYGDIAQNVGGRITVSNGGIANFYDDVTLAVGAANVQATALGSTVSRVVFFGSYNGGVSGGGQAFLEGDHRPGASPALVSFGGDVAYGPFATLEIELAGKDRGDEFDALDVAGLAALGGRLEVVLREGFTPAFGDTFEVIAAAGGISGVFDDELLPDLGTLLDLRVFYDATDVTLAVVPALAGDYNANGVVDAADYIVWRKTFNQSGPGLAADGNGNGQIDPGDYDVWTAHFGQTAGGGAAVNTNAAIPEPATLVLLMFAAAGWGLGRGRVA